MGDTPTPAKKILSMRNKKQMNYWIIADTHFGHNKMVEYCGRPIDFSEKILENLSMIPETDILIHLGDVCWYAEEEWNIKLMKSCPAKKWLLRGNHDKKSNSWYLDKGWHFVAEQMQMIIYGKVVAFSHKPIPYNGYDINIHGHLHNVNHHSQEPELLAIKNKHQILIMMEHDYKPITLKSLIA